MEFGLIDWIGMGSGEIAPVRTSLFPLCGERGLWVGQSVSEHRSVTWAFFFLRPTYYYLI
jgi:hypothetical protein